MNKYAAIRAVSTYLPEKVECNDSNDHLSKKLGIQERHIAAENEAASDLAVHAAEKLFSSHAVEKKDIDFLLLCLQHPDYQVPTTACQV
ncbi:3-oxoacyl-ACP synthase, partial [Selenomonas bovis]|nr:3-oxoacyl-ACP synthase [Selenomonas bovis]